MRIPHTLRTTCLLFLVCSCHTTLALVAPRESKTAVAQGPPSVADVDVLNNEEYAFKSPPKATATSKSASDSLKLKDAPVDGKDGRPHSGPFVETSAERNRKQAKENGEAASASKVQPTKEIPSGAVEVNDGVMDDPNRKGPKDGTRGTEGGISEKIKEGKTGGADIKSEKKPDPPKEIPPLPHSEQASIVDKTAVKDNSKKEKDKPADASKPVDDKKKDETIKEPGGLEVCRYALTKFSSLTKQNQKPADLPDKPHDIPHPVPASVSKTDPLAIFKPYAPNLPSLPITSDSIIQPLHSFALSFTMIIFSEIGDKTFLVAALMAMKHPRLIVFTAALTALIAMTILSAVLGHAVPTLIPKRFTSFLAAILFLVFGAKMLREGYSIPISQGVSEEMREVEMELEEKEELARKMGRRRSSIPAYMLEAGRKPRSQTRLPAPPDSPPASPSRSPSPSRGSRGLFQGVNNLFSFLLSPAWVQTFIMTFLGEWGDRSQIATIAMAAGQDYWWVSGGAVTGHAICTAIAVIGGRAIAGRVSLRIGKIILHLFDNHLSHSLSPSNLNNHANVLSLYL